jgi:muramoyltetrapeptide carboxypeptidase
LIGHFLKISGAFVLMLKKAVILPPRLARGDTLGVASPAASFGGEAFQRGARTLKSMGFEVMIPGGPYEKKGYLAAGDAERAHQLNRLFADPDVKGIVCARGGYGSIRILSRLDYGLIKKNPKVFAGFSDISALLWALWMKTGLAVFHSPTVTTLGDASRKTVSAMCAAFSSESALDIVSRDGVELMPGAASGPLAGGNLTTLCHLTGTPFAPDFGGHILFLEDVGEPAYKIDRALSHMKLAGCFDHVAGVVLGSFHDCGPAGDIYSIFKELFGEYGVPILAGFESGHGKDNLALPMGVEAVLDTREKRLFFHGPATAPRGGGDLG